MATEESADRAAALTEQGSENTRSVHARQKKGLGRYRKGKRLGQGAFGTVYQGIDQLTGQFVAIKVVGVENLAADDEVRNEFSLLQTLSHDNIVRYLDSESSEDGTQLRIYLEYVDGGSLASVVKQYGRLSEVVCSNYIAQVLHGLQYLHSNRVLHRDIKPANLLVSIDASVKLADFGASKKIEDGSGRVQEAKFVGTPAYIAPEAIKGKHTFAADVWSVGCTLLELVTGKQPWAGRITYTDVMDFIRQIANTDVTPIIPSNISPTIKDFLGRCLQRDPNKRDTPTQLLEHPFLNLDLQDASYQMEDEEYEEYEEVEELEEEEEEDAHLTTLDRLLQTQNLSDDETATDEDSANEHGSTAKSSAKTQPTTHHDPGRLCPMSLGEPEIRIASPEEVELNTPSTSPVPGGTPVGDYNGRQVSLAQSVESDGKTPDVMEVASSWDPNRGTPEVGVSHAGSALLSAQGKKKSIQRIKLVMKSPQFQVAKKMKAGRSTSTSWLGSGASMPAEGWFTSPLGDGSTPSGTPSDLNTYVEDDWEEENDLCGLFIAAHHCNELTRDFFTNFKEQKTSADIQEEESPKAQSPSDAKKYLKVTGTPDGLVTIHVPDDELAKKEEEEAKKAESSSPLASHLTYKFDIFFNEDTTPVKLFNQIGKPIIRTLMKSKVPNKKVSITCAGMPYSGKSQTVIGKDNVFQEGQMGFLPLIIQNLFEEYGQTHDFYVSSMCCRKEKKGVFDNVNHKLIDGVGDWNILRKRVLQKADTWEGALADLDLSKLAFLGVKSPHMLVIESRKRDTGDITGTLFVTLFYGRQWTYWLNGLTFLVHHYFVYTNMLAGSGSIEHPPSGHPVIPSPDSSRLKQELARYTSNEFFGITQQIYKDEYSMNYILHNFHGLVKELGNISASLSALGTATRQAPRNAIPGSKEKET